MKKKGKYIFTVKGVDYIYTEEDMIKLHKFNKKLTEPAPTQ